MAGTEWHRILNAIERLRANEPAEGERVAAGQRIPFDVVAAVGPQAGNWA